jgi:hypothetical protein
MDSAFIAMQDAIAVSLPWLGPALGWGISPTEPYMLLAQKHQQQHRRHVGFVRQEPGSVLPKQRYLLGGCLNANTDL